MALEQHQSSFPFHSESDPIPIAPDLVSGVFKLSDLTVFCQTEIEPRCSKELKDPVLIDVSQVKVWDISALLWFAIALQHYRIQGLSFLLKFPDEPIRSRDLPVWQLDAEEKAFCKSRDFLRRWRFVRALKHVCDPADILLPEQSQYFDILPKRFYGEGKSLKLEDGTTEYLLTNRLAEIHDLTRIEGTSQLPSISYSLIEEYVRRFSDSQTWNVIAQNCEVTRDDAQEFVSSLVGESLDNMHQHPSATSGFIAISVLGNTRELILAVVDNGYSISQTILDRYNADFKRKHRQSRLNKLSLKERAKIIDYALQPHVTSKKGDPPKGDKPFGLGLDHIRKTAVKTFKGKLRIVTMSTQIVYDKDHYDEPEITDYPQPWSGNLIRISIPLRKGRR